MKTSIRISLFSLAAALIGFWPAGAGAQTDPLVRCGLGSPGSLLGLAPSGAAAHAAMIQRTLKCLQGASGRAPAAGPAGAGGQFVTFDPPGSTFTSPQGITITGFYTDAKGVQHGFLRDPKGGFTTFDPPGSTSTSVSSISTNGEIVGTYCDTAACPRIHGFVRTRDGAFTTFDSPPGTGGITPALLLAVRLRASTLPGRSRGPTMRLSQVSRSTASCATSTAPSRRSTRPAPQAAPKSSTSTRQA